MTSPTSTRAIILSRYVEGHVTPDHFEQVTRQLATTLEEGQILLRTNYISVDPYLRFRISGTPSESFTSIKAGNEMVSTAIATVVASEDPAFAAGDVVRAWSAPWQDYFIATGETRPQKIEPLPGVPLSYFLGVLGLTGMTAYFGLKYVGEPKAGETVFVSAAAGATGMVVGQIAKVLGCRVVGSAGGKEKCDLLKSLGFDAVLDYKTCKGVNDMTTQLRELCPKGIDVYFENVGGMTLEAVLEVINPLGRIAVCGMISQYNNKSWEDAYGVRNLTQLIYKRVTMKGFLLGDFLKPEYLAAFGKDMGAWLKEGKVQSAEHVTKGLENAPVALCELFEGKNTGKAVVQVAADSA